MKTIVFILMLLFPMLVYSQSLIEAKVIDQWPEPGKTRSVEAIYDRVSSHVFVFNNSAWLNLFKGKQFDKETRAKIGIKKGEEPDYLSVSVRFKHPDIKSDIVNGEDIGIKIPLFSFDQRKEVVSGASFNSFQNSMFLNDVKVESITKDVMGKVEVDALSSNNSAKFWLEVAKISSDFGKSAISLATGNISGLGELKNKLSQHLDQGISNLNGLCSDPIKRNYSTWIKLLSRDVNSDFDEVVTGIRLYEVNWSHLKSESFKEISSIPFPVDSKQELTVDGLKYIIDKSGLTVPLILVVETRTKTKINKQIPQLTSEYKDWASKEHNEYSQKNQYSLIQEFFETYLYAYSSSIAIDNFLSNQGKDEEKRYLFEAINNAYKYYINADKNISSNIVKQSDINLGSIIAVINNRHNAIKSILSSKFSLSDNYNLREAGNIITSLINPLNDDPNEDDIKQFIVRMDQYEQIILLTKNEEAKLSDSYTKSLFLRKKYEDYLYTKIIAKTEVKNRTTTFYEQILVNYPYCKICLNSAGNQINISNAVTLANAKSEMNSLSIDYFKRFNSKRDSLTGQFPIVDQWLKGLDPVSQSKYTPYYNKMTQGILAWIDLVKKDENEINSQTKIEVINQWISRLKNAMNDIIVGSRFFADKGIIKIPNELSIWFTSSDVEKNKPNTP